MRKRDIQTCPWSPHDRDRILTVWQNVSCTEVLSIDYLKDYGHSIWNTFCIRTLRGRKEQSKGPTPVQHENRNVTGLFRTNRGKKRKETSDVKYLWNVIFMTHILSYCVLSQCAILCHVICLSYHVMSSYVMSCYLMSCHVRFRHVMSYFYISHHVMSCRLVLCHSI